jgi:hypothetical protein
MNEVGSADTRQRKCDAGGFTLSTAGGVKAQRGLTSLRQINRKTARSHRDRL